MQVIHSVIKLVRAKIFYVLNLPSDPQLHKARPRSQGGAETAAAGLGGK